MSREVAALAFHFGWSEHDILSLPTIRRQTYIKHLLEMLKPRKG